MKASHVAAVALRQLYLYKRSMARLMEVVYWPTMDLLLWGFLTVYLRRTSGQNMPKFVSYFIGALILWDVLFRAEQGISVSFLEDMWSRNLINVFVTPVTMAEYVLGLIVMSFIKVAAAFALLSVLGWALYSFSILKLGASLLPLVLNLTAMGWAIGIFTTALILRYGLEAEILAWALGFVFLPFSAVFYPVSVLPGFLRAVAAFIPASHAFEGMRAVINGASFPARELLDATALNAVYLALSLLFFRRIYRVVIDRGIIPKIGE